MFLTILARSLYVFDSKIVTTPGNWSLKEPKDTRRIGLLEGWRSVNFSCPSQDTRFFLWWEVIFMRFVFLSYRWCRRIGFKCRLHSTRNPDSSWKSEPWSRWSFGRNKISVYSLSLFEMKFKCLIRLFTNSNLDNLFYGNNHGLFIVTNALLFTQKSRSKKEEIKLSRDLLNKKDFFKK